MIFTSQVIFLLYKQVLKHLNKTTKMLHVKVLRQQLRIIVIMIQNLHYGSSGLVSYTSNQFHIIFRDQLTVCTNAK